MAHLCDVIIVGAGHNGVAAALELASAGLTVVVLELQSEIGGCATTTEPLMPGFRHSPHASTLFFTDVMPRAVAPAGLNVALYHPDAQLGVAFADGRPPVVLHRPDLLARTRRSFAVYSRDDAATYAALKQRSSRLGANIRTGLYAAPSRAWFRSQADAVRAAFKGRVPMQSLGSDSARALIDRLFEAPEVRILLYHLATETGLELDEIGGDLAFLGYSLWIAGRWRIPSGGMVAYSSALRTAALKAGAKIACSVGVERILVEGGRATGVITTKGDKLYAARGVLAATPLLETYDRLVDAAAVSISEGDELAVFRRQSPGLIASSHICLAQAPRYKSAQHDDEIDICLKTIVGHETPESVLEDIAGVRAGLLPKPAGVVRVHSLWDSSLAPPGHHVAGVDTSFPSRTFLGDDEWSRVEQAFPDAFLHVWQNARADAGGPVAAGTDLSARFERRMLVRTGADQYRSSVAGLYLGGPGIYPGGGIHAACGLNAARTILDDIEASDPNRRERERSGGPLR